MVRETGFQKAETTSTSRSRSRLSGPLQQECCEGLDYTQGLSLWVYLLWLLPKVPGQAVGAVHSLSLSTVSSGLYLLAL